MDNQRRTLIANVKMVLGGKRYLGFVADIMSHESFVRKIDESSFAFLSSNGATHDHLSIEDGHVLLKTYGANDGLKDWIDAAIQRAMDSRGPKLS